MHTTHAAARHDVKHCCTNDRFQRLLVTLAGKEIVFLVLVLHCLSQLSYIDLLCISLILPTIGPLPEEASLVLLPRNLSKHNVGMLKA